MIQHTTYHNFSVHLCMRWWRHSSAASFLFNRYKPQHIYIYIRQVNCAPSVRACAAFARSLMDQIALRRIQQAANKPQVRLHRTPTQTSNMIMVDVYIYYTYTIVPQLYVAVLRSLLKWRHDDDCVPNWLGTGICALTCTEIIFVCNINKSRARTFVV